MPYYNDNSFQDGYRGGRRGDRDTYSTPENDPNHEQFRKLFIGGLNYETTETGLRDHFMVYGDIVDCVVMRDNSSGRSRGFGFITYKDVKGIDDSQADRPHHIEGREVETKRAMPRGETNAQQTVKKMFVGGMKESTTEDMIRDYFSEFGCVAEVSMITEKATGKTRGFCFVSFEDYDSVDMCVLKKVHYIDGRNMEVKKAVPKTDMQPKGRNMSSDRGGNGDFRGFDGMGYGGYDQVRDDYRRVGGGGGGGSERFSPGYGGSNGMFGRQGYGGGSGSGGGGWKRQGWGGGGSGDGYAQDYQSNYSGYGGTGAMRSSHNFSSRSQGPYGSGYGYGSGGYGSGGSGGGGGNDGSGPYNRRLGFGGGYGRR